VLPLGNRTFNEMGIEPPPGADPGAPVNPNLKRKFFTTTWVSAIVMAGLLLVIHFHLITLPDLPARHLLIVANGAQALGAGRAILPAIAQSVGERSPLSAPDAIGRPEQSFGWPKSDSRGRLFRPCSVASSPTMT
jgi:predicted secreted protein